MSEPTPDNSATIGQLAALDPAQQTSLPPTLQMASRSPMPTRTPSQTTGPAPATETATTPTSDASLGAPSSQSCDMSVGDGEATFIAVATEALLAGNAGFSVTLVGDSAGGTAKASFVLIGQAGAYACVNVTSVSLLLDVWAQLNAGIAAAIGQTGRNASVHVTDEMSLATDCTGALTVIPAP